jgi:hypothetical protein
MRIPFPAVLACAILGACDDSSVAVTALDGGRYQITAESSSPVQAEDAANAAARAQCAGEGKTARILSSDTVFGGGAVETGVVLSTVGSSSVGAGGSVVASAAPDAFRATVVFSCG